MRPNLVLVHSAALSAIIFEAVSIACFLLVPYVSALSSTMRAMYGTYSTWSCAAENSFARGSVTFLSMPRDWVGSASAVVSVVPGMARRRLSGQAGFGAL